MKDYLLLFDDNEKLKRIINAYEFYDDEVKSTTPGERVLTFKMNDSIIDIDNGNKIGVFIEGKLDLFIVDQVEAETYYSTSIKVTCLHDFYSIQTQKAITQYHKDSVSINDAMTEMLKGTSYELGECVERALMPIGPYLFKNPLWCIQDIIYRFGVEIDYSIELNETRTGIARKLVHVVNALGSDTGIRCSTDLNVSKIKRIEKDKFYTVMYGCGAEYQKDLVKYKYDFKDISWSTSNGNPTDKPTGQEFVEDKKAIAKYGRIIGIFEDGRIKDPELLLKKTWEALQKNNRPIISYELDIEELKTEDGYEHLNFELGDLIILQNTIDNSRAKFRIVEDCKSIRNKYKRKIVVGEQVRGIFSGGDTGNSDGTEGPGGSVIEPGTGEDIKPPSIEEILPDTLPAIPVVTAHGLWKNVQLSWTYENKIYYDYEVYASRIKDFEPTIFHMIYSGKASAFLHEAGPNETWYYKVRAVNSFRNATEFSQQVEATTTKVADGTEYFESAAIKDALIEELRLDRGWIGQLDATYLNVKGKFTILDGNNERTMYVDSFGRIELKPSVFTLTSECVTNVSTKEEVDKKVNDALDVSKTYTNAQIQVTNEVINEKVSQKTYDKNNEIISEKFAEVNKTIDGISTSVNKIEGDYVTSSDITQLDDSWTAKFKSTGYNVLRNTSFKKELDYWGISGDPNLGEVGILDSSSHFAFKDENVKTIQIFMQNKHATEFGIKQSVNLTVGQVYTIGFYANGIDCGWGNIIIEKHGIVEHVQHFNPLENGGGFNKWVKVSYSFEATTEAYTIKIVLRDAGNSGHMWIAKPILCEGLIDKVWTPNPNEIYDGIIRLDEKGMKISHGDGSKGEYDSEGITYYDSNNVKTSAIYDGKFSTIDDKGNVIGYTGKSIWKGTDTYLTALEAIYGSTVGMGTQISGNGDILIPLVVASKGMLIGDTWLQQGLNIINPRTFGKQTFFRRNIGIESVTMEQFADDNDYGVVVGSNGVNVGIIHDNQPHIGFCVEKNLDYYSKCIIQAHTDLNMNNFSILNANISTTLSDTKTLSLEEQMTQDQAYVSYSTTAGEVRYSDRQNHNTVATGHGTYEAFISIPGNVSNNINFEAGYHVNITKLTFGDYRIMEKGPNYFIVESEKENFYFTFEIVAKLSKAN